MKEKLTDNEELMNVMSAAGDEDYAEAAKRIAGMEKSAEESSEQSEYEAPDEKLLRQYEAELDGVEVKYDLDPEELEDALKAFQKKTVYKKNIIYTVLLGTIAICFGTSAFLTPSNIMNYIISVGCLFIIFLIWNLLRQHIKAVKASTGAVKETFSAYVFSDCLFAGSQENGVNQVKFTKKSFVIESKSGFVIGADSERLFLLPYRCMTDDEIQSLRDILKPAFGDRYEIKNEVIA